MEYLVGRYKLQMNRILFICTGNTCRSPMAEAILKNKQLANVEVRSAGVYAMNGQGASGHAKTVLKENEIHHQHCSKLLSVEDVDWATYILTMTASHKATVLQNFPNAYGKTYTLTEFGGEGEQDIVDPYGGNIEIYRKTYKELEKMIDVIGEKLK
jgi:protein arginine phosphatase